MLKKLFLSLGLIALNSFPQIYAAATQPAIEASAATTQKAQYIDGVLPWNSAEGMERLSEANPKEAYFKLANVFESQKNRVFCGPTSMTIVLNALRINTDKAPFDQTAFDADSASKYFKANTDPIYRKYTQNTFFTPAVEKIKTQKQVFGEAYKGKEKDFGIALGDLDLMAKAHGLDSTLQYADEKITDAEIRTAFIETLKTPNHYVIINFFRKAIGENGGGHISPLGAYHEKSDSFLVMDVTPNVAPFVWVRTDILAAAMRAKDGEHPRGYLLLKEGSAH